jgi:TM2 domain-containing membrane protein YozV
MQNQPAATKNPATPTPLTFALFPAFLSYLIPGLGQIYQGRVSKGLLFLVCLNGLFWYGMHLGSWANVYLPDVAKNNRPWNLPDLVINLYNRPQFAGQFWIGVAAWPAICQYNQWWPIKSDHPFWRNFQRTPPESPDRAPPGWEGKSLNELQTNGDKTWDLGWVYTVIAGVLNILVIYDAAAGPAFSHEGQEKKSPEAEAVKA